MDKPELKQLADLSPRDFARYPVWLGVHNYDSDEEWYDESDEETFRPWTKLLPFNEARGFALLPASFNLADGSVFQGFFRSTREDRDAPPGSDQPSWSSLHGGSPRSILLLQSPEIFVGDRALDFQLRVPRLRHEAISTFYFALRKAPGEVFPVTFTANGNLASGAVDGTIDGFFGFNEDSKQFETLTSIADELTPVPGAKPAPKKSNRTARVKPGDGVGQPAVQRSTLSTKDFKSHTVWVRIPLADEAKPWHRSTSSSRGPARFQSTQERVTRGCPPLLH